MPPLGSMTCSPHDCSFCGETSMQGPFSPRYLLALLTCTLLFAPTAPTQAASPGDLQDHILLLAVDQSVLASNDKKLSERAHQLALRELSEEVANRMERRLMAAGIRSQASALPRGRVKLTARTRKPRHWVEGIIAGGGAMEIRPDIDQTFIWSGLGGILPGDIELKETTRGTIAWSAERDPLANFASKLTLAQGELYIVPDADGGWRTLLLGKAVLTHKDLASAKSAQSSIGLPFIQLTFGSSGAASWNAIPRATPMAMVLDGEVITTFQTPNTRSQAQLSLQCSDIWVPANKQDECVEVVVGRLAAPIPMKVTIMTGKE